MTSVFRRIVPLLLALVTILTVLACHGSQGSGRERIKIWSKNFIEQLIWGEIYTLVLENKGFKVERKLNLGGTPVAQASLQQGEIDLYPEYTSTRLLTVLKLPTNSDPQQVYHTVADGELMYYKFKRVIALPIQKSITVGWALPTNDQISFRGGILQCPPFPPYTSSCYENLLDFSNK